jgi:hypothetical protein
MVNISLRSSKKLQNNPIRKYKKVQINWWNPIWIDQLRLIGQYVDLLTNSIIGEYFSTVHTTWFLRTMWCLHTTWSTSLDSHAKPGFSCYPRSHDIKARSLVTMGRVLTRLHVRQVWWTRIERSNSGHLVNGWRHGLRTLCEPRHKSQPRSTPAILSHKSPITKHVGHKPAGHGTCWPHSSLNTIFYNILEPKAWQ